MALDDAQVVARFFSRQPEQLVDQEWRGEDRRAGVKGEAVLFVDVGATARLVARLVERDLVAARLEPDRGCDSAEAASDDDRMRAVRRRPGRLVDQFNFRIHLPAP